MKYQGHIENGKVVFDTPVPLPEGAKVEVTVISSADSGGPSTQAEPTMAWMLKYSGIAKDLPADAARNLDHYLYGHPKQ